MIHGHMSSSIHDCLKIWHKFICALYTAALMLQYDETENIAVGTYQFTRPSKSSKIPRMEMCHTHYKLSRNWVHNQSYEFDAAQETCMYNWLYSTIL